MRKWGKEKGKGVRVPGVVILVMKKGEGKARGRREDGKAEREEEERSMIGMLHMPLNKEMSIVVFPPIP